MKKAGEYKDESKVNYDASSEKTVNEKRHVQSVKNWNEEKQLLNKLNQDNE